MIIGKTFKFDAAHFLPGHPKCGVMHGHTYTLTVEVEGPIKPEEGMVMDLHSLTDLIECNLLSWYDHKLLNDTFRMPTCELLCKAFVQMIQQLLNSYDRNLYSLTLQEGQGGYAKWQKDA